MNTTALRQKILDLAVSGRLVPQIPSEGDARDLLASIRAAAPSLRGAQATKQSSSNSNLKPISPDEIPFEIPASWVWVRLGEIAFVTKLAGFEYSEYVFPNLKKSGIPLFKGKNIQNSSVIYEFEAYIPEEISDELQRSQVTRKCLLTPYVGTIGNIGIHDKKGKFHLGSNVGKIETFCPEKTLDEYIFYYLKSGYGYKELTKTKKATAQESISIEAIRQVFIPIPPLAEQKRTVEKVEKIFAQIKIIEKNKLALRTLSEQARAKLLDLAVRGSLVPQIPSEGDARDLLASIRAAAPSLRGAQATKQSSSNSNLKSKQFKFEPIDENEIPFEIPSNWVWVRLEEITKTIGNKTNQIKTKEILKEGSIAVVSQGQDLIDGYSNEIDKTITDLPLVMFGDHTRNVKYIDFPFVIGADGTKFLKPILVNAKYLFYLVRFVAQRIRNRGYARHYALLKEFPLPLPPLAEQKRIVAAVEAVLPLVEKLGE